LEKKKGNWPGIIKLERGLRSRSRTLREKRKGRRKRRVYKVAA
jgi:hypothetical protein